MGGDRAPEVPIAGALLALAELDPAHTVQLVGRTDEVSAELDTQLRAATGLPPTYFFRLPPMPRRCPKLAGTGDQQPQQITTLLSAWPWMAAVMST